MATMDVKDAAGLTVAVEKPLAPGSAADSASRPVAFSTEGKAQLGSVTETAPASDTASSGLNGRLQRIAQRITSLIALLPASLGSKAASASLAVTDSTEDIARVGIVTETAPASDTASSGLNGRLQRIAQRLTSLIALVPASLGSKADSASLAVTHSTEDKALLGTKTTSVTALETGGTGIIGWLSQAWRELVAIRVAAQSAITSSATGKASVTTSSTEVLPARVGRQKGWISNKGSLPIYYSAGTPTTSNARLDPLEAAPWLSEQACNAITASGTNGEVHFGEFY